MAKYNKKLGLQIAELYGMGKAKVVEICERFNINPDTFYDWKKNKPDFSDAISHYENLRLSNLAGMALDGLEVLLNGKTFTERKIIYETYYDPKTKKNKQKVVGVTETEKTILPNPKIVMDVLYNRKPGEWKNASHIDHTSKGESMGFASFLQQTKPADSEASEKYVPDHRE